MGQGCASSFLCGSGWGSLVMLLSRQHPRLQASPGSPAAGPMTKFTHWSLSTGLPHPQAAGFPQGERSQKTRVHPEWKLQSFTRLRSNFCYFYPTLVIRSEAVNPAHAQILGDYTRMVNVRRRGRLGQLRGPAMGFPGGSMV